jgi:hypothetical protein
MGKFARTTSQRFMKVAITFLSVVLVVVCVCSIEDT